MHYDTRTLSQSYTLLIAEEPAAYSGVETSSGKSRCNTAGDAQGQTLHLAMALIDGVSTGAEDRFANADRLRALTRRANGRPDHSGEAAAPPDDDALIERLRQLVRSNDRNLAEQLSLFLQVDERELWREAGCRDVLHWMDLTLGIGRISALERLRVARALRSLSVIEALFAVGRLSWSKVRALTRVANPANEQALAAAALELSASETVALCQRWEHREQGDGSDPGEDGGNAESRQAERAFAARSLTWRNHGAGVTRITLDLPHCSAAELLKALEVQEDALREDEPESTDTPPTPRQRRADAAMLMSAHALAHTGEPIATADRYRVFVHLDARLLGDPDATRATSPAELPAERPTIAGFGPIAVSTARRLASLARLTVIATDAEGEVVATGRDARLFSPASVKALIARDRCCQMPGCTRTRWLHAHHVVPWTEGGETTVANGALVCHSCHMRLHEGGLRLERVSKDTVALPGDEALTLTVEEQARARAMLAAVQRFRLVDRDGQWMAGPRRRSRWAAHGSASDHPEPFTRVNAPVPLWPCDQLAQYRVDRRCMATPDTPHSH